MTAKLAKVFRFTCRFFVAWEIVVNFTLKLYNYEYNGRNY